MALRVSGIKITVLSIISQQTQAPPGLPDRNTSLQTRFLPGSVRDLALPYAPHVVELHAQTPLPGIHGPMYQSQ